MSDEHEWTEWRDHDGSGCPVPNGVWCHRVFDAPARGEDATVIGALEDISPVDRFWEADSWEWWPGCVRVIRYRIRRPRALIQLIEMVENLPETREVETT